MIHPQPCFLYCDQAKNSSGESKKTETKEKQAKPIGFEAPRGGTYNNRKHLKQETPCS